MIKLNITNKLASIIVIGIVSFAICLGIYFDSYLKDSYYKEAKNKLENGFSRLILEVQKIESNLKSGISFVQNDEAFIASIDLVNSYQDKNNYNEILLDEEKKLIASKLLDKVKLSLNDDITLYDKNEELIASVRKKNGEYILKFLSFENGKTLIYSKNENEDEYTKQEFTPNLQKEFKHTRATLLEKNNSELTAITYFFFNDTIYIKSHLNIKNTNSKNILAHIEMAKKLDKPFFDSLPRDINVSVGINKTFEENFQTNILSDINLLKNLKIEETSEHYYSQTLINTTNKIAVGIKLFLDKKILLNTLNEIRIQIFLMIIVILIFMLTVLRFLFYKLLAKPFNILMHQIEKIEKRDYSNSTILQSGDELEIISQNVNNLALALESREKELQATYDNLLYFSNRDPLTMLANRRYFISELDNAIKEALEKNKKVALLFIDLDYFKDINDSLGHNVGDKLLQAVSNKLLKIVEELGLVGRFGGDEFVVLINKFDSDKK